MKKLIAVIPVIPALLQLAISTTKFEIEQNRIINNLNQIIQQLKIENTQRKNFIPFIYRKTELSLPQSITVAALLGGSMKFELQSRDIMNLSLDDQLKIASGFIIKDYAKNKGESHLFGKITGYYFQRQYDICSEFDIYGNVIKLEISDLKLYPTPFARPYINLNNI